MSKDNPREGISCWRARSEWMIDGYKFILERVPERDIWQLYSEIYPQIRVDSSTVRKETQGKSDKEIVEILVKKIRFIYQMYVKFNINNWE